MLSLHFLLVVLDPMIQLQIQLHPLHLRMHPLEERTDEQRLLFHRHIG